MANELNIKNGFISNNNSIIQGSLGIGTATPSTTLQVSSATNQGVVIGTTLYPNWMGTNGLYVDGSFRANSYLLQSGSGINWGASQAKISGFNPNTGSDTYLSFFTGGISTNGERIRIIDNGNVGIGTATPTVKLQVLGSVQIGSYSTGISGYTNGLSVTNPGAAATSLFLYQAGVASGHIGLRSSDTNLYIVNSYTDGLITNSSAIVLTSTGNVGIGTTTPTYKLDVQGSALLNSSISTQGGLNINVLAAPTAITGYTLSTGSSLGVGNYYYFVVYVITGVGETSAGSLLTVTTTTGTTTVNLTGIPVSSDSRVSSRKLYRTKLGGSTDNEWFLATINDNTTTTYIDSIADTSLTGTNLQQYKINTTSRFITVAGVQAMIVDQNLTTLGKNAGNNIISTNAAAVRTVLVGAGVGQNITTGTGNAIVGGFAGQALTTGSGNSLLGDVALYATTTGYYNVAIGSSVGRYITTGNNNIFIGTDAATFLNDGTTQFTAPTSGIYIGTNVKGFSLTETNAIVIGNAALGLGSNTTVLGNTSTAKTAIYGRTLFGTTTDDGVTQVQVTGNLSVSSQLGTPNISYTSIISSNGGEVRINQLALTFGNTVTQMWSSTYDSNGTKDLGLRRNNAGVLEIYNGITADGNLVNRRDLLVRTITASTASITGTNPTPLIVERTGGSNANIQFKNDAGTVYAGGRNSSFGIGPDKDLVTTSQLTVFTSTGNVVIQNGGSSGVGPTDTGYRLDVSGTTRLNGQTTVTGGLTASSLAITSVGATAGLTNYLVSDSNGNVFYQAGVGAKGATGATGETGPIYDASLAIAYSVVFG